MFLTEADVGGQRRNPLRMGVLLWVAFVIHSIAPCCLQASASLRQIPPSSWGDSDTEIRCHGRPEVFAKCKNRPVGHAAGCLPIGLHRVPDLQTCVQAILHEKGGDTFNYRGQVCQVQQCSPVSRLRVSILAPQPHASGPPGTFHLSRTLETDADGAAGARKNMEEAADFWIAWPGLQRTITFTAQTGVFAIFQISLRKHKGFLAAALFLNGSEVQLTRSISSSNSDFRGLQLAGAYTAELGEGVHKFSVRFKQEGLNQYAVEEDGWHHQVLQVFPLPFVSTHHVAGPLPNDMSQEVGAWADLGILATTERNAAAVVLVSFQIIVNGATTAFTASLFVDDVEQSQTRCHSAGVKGFSCYGIFLGRIQNGTHTFSVKYLSAGIARMSSGTAWNWEGSALNVTVLDNAAISVQRVFGESDVFQQQLEIDVYEPETYVLVVGCVRTAKSVPASDWSSPLVSNFGLSVDSGLQTVVPSSLIAFRALILPNGRHRIFLQAEQASDVIDLRAISFKSAVRYTTLYGDMAVYSTLCYEGNRQSAHARVENQIGLISKTDDYWTTSAEMKEDLRAYFEVIARNWTALELGSYRGFTTRVLASVFNLVFAVDASSVFLADNKHYNTNVKNIIYVNLHTRMDSLSTLRQNSVEVVFIDAEHDYISVSQDVKDVIEAFRHSLRFLVFDDYATDDGVRQVVEEFSQAGLLNVVGNVGKAPPWIYHGRRVNHWEGVICEFSDASATSTIAADNGRPVGFLYTWLRKTVWQAEDLIHFEDGGNAITTRGPGRWRRNPASLRKFWLDWPATKPKALGGVGNNVTMVTWNLQFDQHYEKFAAVQAGTAESAAGVSADIFAAIERRIFVSITHEWCSSANVCIL